MAKTSSRDISIAISQFCIAIFSSIILIPLSIIIPKKKNRIVVIGRQNDLFIDNAKHFFLFLCNSATPRPDVVFLVFSEKSHTDITEAGLPVCTYPNLKSILYLFTANLVIVDSAEWIKHGKFQLAFGSRIIQLWHGAPLKQIELPLYHQRMEKYPAFVRTLFKFYKFITGRHATNELVVSTSSFFTEKAFKPAFHARRFIDTGYPRNDALFADIEVEKLNSSLYINTDRDTIRNIISIRKSETKTILFAPTFRHGLDDPFSESILDLDRFDTFSRENNVCIVLKLHPVMAEQIPEGQHANIINYNATADIYPALNLFDALITDYSSIYFDYLLLDRPVIFYPYDYDNYIRNDRSLLFDYKQMAPGHICMSQDEIEAALLQIADDPYKQKRKEVLDLVFNHKDDMASSRLWQVLRDDYILKKVH